MTIEYKNWHDGILDKTKDIYYGFGFYVSCNAALLETFKGGGISATAMNLNCMRCCETV